jgi:thiamine pyrophosphate-dependent acetolactate synthase large subunit-like protein
MAVGLALALPHRPVVCLDGDGSVLMELGQLVVLGQEAPQNLCVFVVDNGVYESIGWSAGGRRRPTATAASADLAAIATGCGVPYSRNIETMEELDAEIDLAFGASGRQCRFLNVKTLPGNARVPPRQTDGFEDKYRFVRYVERTEGKAILHRAEQDRQLM